jgi:hypothetical protein
MSLINDALRRAKDAEQQVPLPPARDLPFRPVEPAQQSARHGLGLLLPAALAAVALLTLLLVWQWVQRHNPAEPAGVSGRTARVASAVAAPQPASAPAAAGALAVASQPDPATQSASRPSPATGAATNTPVAAAQESEVTNAPAMTPPPPPKPAPLRLQAIIFNPTRPSAMISGKTLFVGDKLGDMRVVAIDHESATLVGGGQTNVLSLAE